MINRVHDKHTWCRSLIILVDDLGNCNGYSTKTPKISRKFLAYIGRVKFIVCMNVGMWGANDGFGYEFQVRWCGMGDVKRRNSVKLMRGRSMPVPSHLGWLVLLKAGCEIYILAHCSAKPPYIIRTFHEFITQICLIILVDCVLSRRSFILKIPRSRPWLFQYTRLSF